MCARALRNYARTQVLNDMCLKKSEKKRGGGEQIVNTFSALKKPKKDYFRKVACGFPYFRAVFACFRAVFARSVRFLHASVQFSTVFRISVRFLDASFRAVFAHFRAVFPRSVRFLHASVQFSMVFHGFP